MAICPAGIASSGYYVLPSTNWAPLTETIMGDVTYGAPVTMKWLNNQFVTVIYSADSASTKRVWVNSDPRSGAAWTGYNQMWSTEMYNSMTSFIDIEHINGNYVVIGTQNLRYSSSLGGTWTKPSISMPAGTEFRGIAKNGSTLYLYGRDGSQAALWTSTNGSSFNGPYSLGSSMYAAQGVAFFPAVNRMVYVGYGSDSQYFRVLEISTLNATEQSIVANASGSSASSASGVWADTTNNQLIINDGNTLWQRPVMSNGYRFDTHGPANGNYTVSTYGQKSPNISANAGAFVNGKNVIFGSSGTLRYLTPASYQSGYSSTSTTESTNLPNNSTMLQGSARWGGVYSPTLNYWLGMDFSDASFNYSKKYNKIVYTDNPLF